MYYRILAQYDNTKSGIGNSTFKNMNQYWLALGLYIIGYFIFSIIKYFFIFFGILNVNKAIHKDMIHGIVRSPCSYFDIISSGQLISKVSNDLGIMDYVIINVLIDSVEGPIINLIFIGNVIFINIYFLIPSVIIIVLLIFGFLYCKNSAVAVKQLDLRIKSPIFNMVG